jgi:hypothetical protein
MQPNLHGIISLLSRKANLNYLNFRPYNHSIRSKINAAAHHKTIILCCTEQKTYGVAPSLIYEKLKQLVDTYESTVEYTLDDILSFHVYFELVHPFEDGNGRVGRAIMIKECLCRNIEPFIIDDKHRSDYNRGIREWKTNTARLLAVALRGQERLQNQRALCDIMEYSRPATGRGAR